ncbi:MAG: hypothetical protein RIS47_19 [Bacteroidota bacterium]|jgi:precorrin-2 dehydrogenase/sirohydrochlorin ferrochelatase
MNELYPIFLKLHTLEMLIVGGGNVGFEKLNLILKSSPNARVSMVAETISPECLALLAQHNLPYTIASYNAQQLTDKQIVIAATNNKAINQQISTDARARRILVNVADTPKLCDFYLGSIVTRGNVKIAISTNGKSPTLAKRLREFLEDIIPENIDELSENLHKIRNKLAGDFRSKIDKLNDITSKLID